MRRARGVPMIEDVATRAASLPRALERTASPPRPQRSPWTAVRIALTDARALAGALAAMAPLLLRRRPVGREGAPTADTREPRDVA
jgi:hypothetical protein